MNTGGRGVPEGTVGRARKVCLGVKIDPDGVLVAGGGGHVKPSCQ